MYKIVKMGGEHVDSDSYPVDDGCVQSSDEHDHDGGDLTHCLKCHVPLPTLGDISEHMKSGCQDVLQSSDNELESDIVKEEKADDDLDEEFSCTECDETFTLTEDLTEHENTHTNIPSDCDTKQDTPPAQQAKAPSSVEVDNACKGSKTHGPKGSKTHGRKGSKTHSRKPKKAKLTYSCDKCERNFLRLAHLEIHARTHTGYRPYQCAKCQRSYGDPSNLRKHMKSHSEEIPFVCSLCEETFTLFTDLKKHMDIHKDDERLFDSPVKRNSRVPGEPLICLECGQIFKHHVSLKTHMIRMHNKDGGYSCSECEMIFPHQSYLKIHMMSQHIRDRQYKCSECDKRFNLPFLLKSHMMTHSKVPRDKPYSCAECEKKFVCSARLSTHMSVHTGDKPHICWECGKAYTQAGNLKIHMKASHSDTYKCPVCNELFSSKGDLRKHKTIHREHMEATHSCTICDRKFARAGNLERHVIRCTGKKPAKYHNWS